MSSGVVFDIKEMAIYDGPGLRTTVFLKGCPLRCMWCHNPEGLSYQPQLMVATSNCVHCGKCMESCPRQGKDCVSCGTCIRHCPQGIRKICGKVWEASDLEGRLLKDADYLKRNGGGVTFSGGEPTGQPEFLIEMLDRTASMHRAVETCGFCREEIFRAVLERVDYVMMDIKMVDREKHKRYTGVSNEKILRNLELLKAGNVPFRIRIPVIPGVNDDDENFGRTAQLLKNAENLEIVELLPYHVTAGAKYEMVNREYHPDFDESRQPRLNLEIFQSYGIPCSHL